MLLQVTAIHSFIAGSRRASAIATAAIKTGEGNRQEHGSRAGIDLLKESRRPRPQDCSHTANAKLHSERRSL